MNLILYGIRNCDTVRKARNWLKNQHINYQYHDLRTDGLDPGVLKSWLDQKGYTEIINQRSKSWRQLPEEQKRQLNDSSALALIQDNPTLIKRPILAGHQLLLIGFSDTLYNTLLTN